MQLQKAIEDRENYLNRYTHYVKEMCRRSDKVELDRFTTVRAFDKDIVEKLGIFYVKNREELLHPNYLQDLYDFGVVSQTNNFPIYANRFVIPIPDETGRVLGLVGYSFDAAERYIYAVSKYYERTSHLWGLDVLDLCYDLGYAILTEGITDAIMLRCLGYPNTLAWCGTSENPQALKMLNRCRYGVITFSDRDRAGERVLQKVWQFNSHLALRPFIQYKDIDEMCNMKYKTAEQMEKNRQHVKKVLDVAIAEIKTKKYFGRRVCKEEFTIT